MKGLDEFTLSDMIKCGTELRTIGADAQSMEEVAQKIVKYLYDYLVHENREKSCSLVRFYKTHSFGGLDTQLSEFAQGLLGNVPASPTMKCLTLLGTVGEKEQWNFRTKSAGHKAIPLPSENAVLQIPMIAQLIKQFGVEINNIIQPSQDVIVNLEQKGFNVFYVEKALGSPYVPAQEDFVIPYGIQSVLGYGGMLPSGDIFAIIKFSKIHIPKEIADLFKTLTLNIKMAILPFEEKVFSQ